MVDDTLPVVTVPGPTLLPRGARLGRYTLLEPLGAGGMGTVFAAHDPQLDRRIAIKVLRTPASDPTARAELLREGQALAMLSHPNVVPVFDVGIADAMVWLAMPEVRGGSLGQWLASARGWREIVAMFVATGRGLAAAHDAGLVHGDFKPPNVLLDGHGQPCVVDFGLARRTSGSVSSDHGVPEAVPMHDESTRDGVVRGTPAYMAPEQMCGQPLDARTDQFAFCVALFVALYGRHPFIDADHRSTAVAVKPLLARIDAGRIAPRHTRSIPRGIDRVLVRGLAARPADRWPSMHDVVDRLERSLGRRTRGVAAMLGVGVGVAALLAWPDRAEVAPCDGERMLDAVWNDERAAAVAERLGGFEVRFAADTAARVGNGLDAWARRWRERYTELCAAADPEALRCLDDAKAGFATTVDVLERADQETLARASRAVQSLPSPQACGSESASSLVDSAAVAALSRQLAEIEALDAVGRLDAALVAAQAAVVTADALGEPIAAARAHRLLGGVFESTGDYPRAEAELDRARWIAVEAGRDDLAVAAMASLIKIVGHDLARLDDARAIERHAEAALARFSPLPRTLASLRNAEGLLRLAAGEPDAAIERFAEAVELTGRAPDGEQRLQAPLNNYANALAAAGRYVEARAALERASALVEKNLGPNHPLLVGYASNLGFIADRQGRGDQAREFLERAVALGEELLPPGHPGTFEATNNLAVFYYSSGEIARAKALFERVLVEARRAVGADHPSLGRVIGNIALCETELGDPQGALVRYDEALALEERGLGPDHIDVALTLNNRGSALRKLGRFAEARASYDRALAIRLDKLGEAHPDTGTTINNLGSLALAEGAPRDALPYHERAHDIWLRVHGEQHYRIAAVLTDRAAAHVALGETEIARGLLERAAAIWDVLEQPDPTAVAATELALGELLSDDPVRARALARRALDAFTAAGAAWSGDVTRARALLERIGG